MIFHPISPVFNENSKILILGSFPSPKSREVKFFYGNKQNRFWKILEGVFNEEIASDNEERKNFLLKHKIALWDVVKSCEIIGASDSSLTEAVPNDFDIIFSSCDIKKVFTTGKTAHKLYNKLTGKDSICLPSPSPANCAAPLVKLIENYKIILNYI